MYIFFLLTAHVTSQSTMETFWRRERGVKGWQVIFTVTFNPINKLDKQIHYNRDSSTVSMYKASNNIFFYHISIFEIVL